MNIKKGPGSDRILSIDLKTNAESLVPDVQAIINRSLMQSYVPNLMKVLVVRRDDA